MTYRQSEMYNCAKYLKNLPLQPVSSRGNLQVVDTYNKLLHDNITKTYKHGSEENISEINNELNHIANKLSIGNRIECMKKREAFISLKDHKENFQNNPKYRLINPAKSDSGKISKSILDRLNLLEICLPPEDSLWMKQTVVVSF